MPLLLRGFPLILYLFRMWRKLPPAQKRRMLQSVGRYGLPFALAVGRKAQAEARRRRGTRL
jgi:hypothetical protein